MTQTTDERIAEFCENLTVMYADHYQERNYPAIMARPTFEPDYGRKYVRIVEHENGKARSVYCFIDLTNGDILKAAGWKGPAKGKRGSIWNESCDVGLNKPANLFTSGLYK